MLFFCEQRCVSVLIQIFNRWRNQNLLSNLISVVALAKESVCRKLEAKSEQYFAVNS